MSSNLVLLFPARGTGVGERGSVPPRKALQAYVLKQITVVPRGAGMYAVQVAGTPMSECDQADAALLAADLAKAITKVLAGYVREHEGVIGGGR